VAVRLLQILQNRKAIAGFAAKINRVSGFYLSQ
jgi:hypothetical protein